tara:strand:+ start:4104 stop:4817 length:714 start_codon:yes stop_codon:yes gene_type:complete
MLHIIGTGLHDGKDISLRGLEAIKSADFVYLENYTSKLQCSFDELSKTYGKEITVVDREFVEDGQEILSKAKDKNVVLLIIGDVFSATTHIALYQEAKEKGVKANIIHNASVLTAIGITGLSLYKFGQTTSIAWHDSDVPMKVIESNKPLHTLCLLDLDPKTNKYMQSKDAIARLEKKSFNTETKVVVCAQLGSEDPTIIYAKAKEIENLEKFPQCLIIPGNLHFLEEEVLETYTKV